MAQRYRIYAYSQQANQKQQSHDIIGDVNLADPNYAQLKAQEYANRLNKNMLMGQADWAGSTEAYEHLENPQPFQLPGRPS